MIFMYRYYQLWFPLQFLPAQDFFQLVNGIWLLYEKNQQEAVGRVFIKYCVYTLTPSEMPCARPLNSLTGSETSLKSLKTEIFNKHFVFATSNTNIVFDNAHKQVDFLLELLNLQTVYLWRISSYCKQKLKKTLLSAAQIWIKNCIKMVRVRIV